MNPRLPLAAFLCLHLASFGLSGEPKPVPTMQAIPLPDSQVSFQRDGVELARYWYGPNLKRPFVFPLIGPAGRSITRMGHPHDPITHSHHNSVWIAHQFVNGLNFWEDKPGVRIAQQRLLKLEDSDSEAYIETENAWQDAEGKPALWELRRTAAQALPNKEWLLCLDIQFEARTAPVTLGQTAFGFAAVRLAKTIGVIDGGGTIRNSEGAVDEKECFRKPARWVDYSGPIAPGVTEGATLFDHPANVNHPAPFHVRNDGWMGAAPTFPGEVVIPQGGTFRLRYAVYVHSGAPSLTDLQARWETFAKTEFREFDVKRGK